MCECILEKYNSIDRLKKKVYGFIFTCFLTEEYKKKKQRGFEFEFDSTCVKLKMVLQYFDINTI